MNTCKTCKYWIVAEGTDKFGVCYSPYIIYDDNISIDSNKATVVGQGARLVTGCDFGCILHEVKV